MQNKVRDRRRWADVAVIIIGLGLFGLAVWYPPFATTSEAPQAISLWPVYAAAGGLTLVGLFVGQRWEWRQVARLLLIVAVAILVVGLIRVRGSGTVAWVTLAVPAIVLLLATPYFGPMPRAAEG